MLKYYLPDVFYKIELSLLLLELHRHEMLQSRWNILYKWCVIKHWQKTYRLALIVLTRMFAEEKEYWAFDSSCSISNADTVSLVARLPRLIYEELLDFRQYHLYFVNIAAPIIWHIYRTCFFRYWVTFSNKRTYQASWFSAG